MIKGMVSFWFILFVMILGFIMGGGGKKEDIVKACKNTGSYRIGPKEVLDCKVRTL